MTSTVILPIAQQLAAIAAAIDGVTAYDTDPGMAGIEGNPAIVVSLPSIDRGDLDSDPQLGSRGWTMTFPVSIYVDLDDPTEAITLMRETVEAFISGLDGDDQLSGSVITAKVTNAEPAIDATTQRPRLIYDCSVVVRDYV